MIDTSSKEPVLRVSEVYLSIQGEGPRVGIPTVFVRFGGCNLRCPGWPCDTQHAIDPVFRNEWIKNTPEELFQEIKEAARGYKNICFTGGEPFLQSHKALKQLSLLLWDDNYDIECFSNGTLMYPMWAADGGISFVIDYKLAGSGEFTEGARQHNIHHESSNQSVVKFTIASEADFLQAVQLWVDNIPKWMDVYAGVVWGQLENEQLVDWILEAKLPWKLNVQIHNHIWDRTKRGI